MDPQHIVSDLKGLKKDHVVSEIKTAFSILKLEKHVMTQVAGDASKTKFGIYIIAVGAIASFLGWQIFGGWFRPSIVNGLINALIQTAMMVASIFVLSFVAKKFFKGAAEHIQLFRVAAYSMILAWAYIHPTLGGLAMIWSLVVFFIALQTIHKLSTKDTVLTIVVAMVILIVANLILAQIGFGMAGLGSRSYSSGRSFDFGGSKDGASFNFGEGGMRIKTPDGEMNFTIPNIK